MGMGCLRRAACAQGDHGAQGPRSDLWARMSRWAARFLRLRRRLHRRALLGSCAKMIRSIQIEGLRGITEGSLQGLGPLTVLVGPSGAGKSTVLDALLIAASSSPGDGVGRVIKRRPELQRGAPWLFARGGSDARIVIEGDGFVKRTCKLSVGTPTNALWQVVPPNDRTSTTTTIHDDITSSKHGKLRAQTVVSAKNDYWFDLATHGDSLGLTAFTGELRARLIEPAAGANHEPLHRIYSKATSEGGLGQAVSVLQEVVAELKDLRVLTFEDATGDTPILHLDFGAYTVPVAGAGSGVYALVRLALELAATHDGVALIEEPEIHQHPRALHQSAKVLHAAAARGVQIILSTHSLDLIDSLVSTADDAALERLRVIRISRSDEGRLRHSTFQGKEVAEARNEMGEDLR